MTRELLNGDVEIETSIKHYLGSRPKYIKDVIFQAELRIRRILHRFFSFSITCVRLFCE